MPRPITGVFALGLVAWLPFFIWHCAQTPYLWDRERLQLRRTVEELQRERSDLSGRANRAEQDRAAAEAFGLTGSQCDELVALWRRLDGARTALLTERFSQKARENVDSTTTSITGWLRTNVRQPHAQRFQITAPDNEGPGIEVPEEFNDAFRRAGNRVRYLRDLAGRLCGQGAD